MHRPVPSFARIAASFVALLVVSAGIGAAQERREEFQNLKVFPKDVDPRVLRATMSQFTRALGVRCSHCHVGGEDGQPHRREDFPRDDKPTKEKARAMMRMTRDLNEKYLAALDTRSHPPVQVQCFTCHRGVAQPRTLQETLQLAYATGGLDSARTRYTFLRDRYYGRAAYDFGEVPLADVAAALRDSGHVADAASLMDLNVQWNPNSAFAKRQHAEMTVFQGFGELGPDSGRAAYRAMKARYGPAAVPEDVLNRTGYALLAEGKKDAALAAFQLNASEHPQSGNVYDSLGEFYARTGNRKLAIESYTKAAELDSADTNAREQLRKLRGRTPQTGDPKKR